ncbi:protein DETOXIFICATION 16-like isoform X3 [Juglans regia]|uniref:Protein DETOXIFICATION 16-like isoform X3 n=1 Tax=Juglans regia TaxID=51240 RepID=A0A6P9E8I1_JUGRE|nr:protein DETOXIFICATION 16-like isoform X3 [Juglans regia]
MLQYSLQVISIMFNGHLGELPLSGASIGSSFASVTGFTVLLGMGSALETLCGQAYGAKQYHMLGVHTQRAMLTLLALSIPLALIWYYTSTILIALGQDHEISTEAGVFNRWMIPSLFAFGLLQCLNRFLQTQNNVIPMLISSGITALLHVPVCWVLVFKIGFGIKGAALAISISNWVNVLLLAIYVKFSTACAKTWTGFSEEALHDLLSFIKLAVSSAIMICFEYWSFEMVVLLSGLLPNPKLETSVLSIRRHYKVSHTICFSNISFLFTPVPWSIPNSMTCSQKLRDSSYSTRVSNELGAGRPHGARLALSVMIIVSISEGAIVGITTILVRNVWGKLYSNEVEVVRYVAKMMPLLALSDFLDGFQCVLSGAARGCGWQNLCAFINLGAYYVGLWMGIISALSVQVIALITVNLYTDWNIEAMKAARGVQKSDIIIDTET